jgi:type IV pilus assembly protein PilN
MRAGDAEVHAVILINLLPHREEKRQRRRVAYFTGLAVGAVTGLLVAGLWYGVLDQMKSSQMERNAFLGAEIKKLEAQIKDIANLRAEIDALQARQKAVEDLQTNRNIPVHVLNELVKQTPEGVYLSSIRQTGNVVALTGVAQSNERVSEFLRNALYSSTWLEKPELIEIAAGAATAGRGRAYNFSMRVSIKRAQAPAPVAVAASVAAAAKAP